MNASRPPRAAVIIPAHNEAGTVGRCLDTLLAGSHDREFDVVVVANACTDDTAEIAADRGVRVIRTPIAGKIQAIRLGDAAVASFPRVYLDADVEIDADGLRALVAELQAPEVLACAPRCVLDLTGVSGPARRVHRVHDTLMRSRRGLAGVGVYALGRDGHRRAFPLPDVVADDEWVDRSFGVHERRVAATAHSVVRPPANLRAHLRRRRRVRRGNRQLESMGRPAVHGRLGLRALAALVADGTVGGVDACWYLAVGVADRLLYAWAQRRSRPVDWATDNTTRGRPAGSLGAAGK